MIKLIDRDFNELEKELDHLVSKTKNYSENIPAALINLKKEVISRTNKKNEIYNKLTDSNLTSVEKSGLKKTLKAIEKELKQLVREVVAYKLGTQTIYSKLSDPEKLEFAEYKIKKFDKKIDAIDDEKLSKIFYKVLPKEISDKKTEKLIIKRDEWMGVRAQLEKQLANKESKNSVRGDSAEIDSNASGTTDGDSMKSEPEDGAVEIWYGDEISEKSSFDTPVDTSVKTDRSTSTKSNSSKTTNPDNDIDVELNRMDI